MSSIRGSFYAFLLITSLAIAGCGGSVSETATLSGKLSTGIINTMIIKDVAADESYTVVLVDNSSNKTYQADVSADGTFSIEDIPSDGRYIASIIKDGNYLGPIVFTGNVAGDEVVTGIVPYEDTDLGDVIVDSTEGFAITEDTPGIADPEITAKAEDNKPLGAGNDGKTKNEGITPRDDSDEDQDGIPNIFDADEDNDGIRNGIISAPSAQAVVSDYIEAVYVTSNIWANHGTTDEAKDLIQMRLHVEPKQGKEDDIADVRCVSYPASIADVATVGYADSLGNPEDYPEEDSDWKDAQYKLFKTTTLDPEEWIIQITPRAIMSVGDVFTIRVTYGDGTYEDFFITMSYVLTDWARILSYDDGAETPMPDDEGTSQTPITFNNNELTITFSKAKDEDGNVLEGLSYSVRYGESDFDVTEHTYLVPTDPEEDPVTDDDPSSESLSFTINTTTVQTYYITPVAEATGGGQRNGEETWFTRE